MDETEKTQQDTLAEGQPSPEGAEGTPEQETQTYTKADLDKAVLDAKANWGREVKPIREQAEKLTAEKVQTDQELKDTRDRLQAHQRLIDQMEENAAKGTPDLLDAYKERKRLRELANSLEEDRRQVKKEQLQLEGDKQELTKFKKQREIETIAGEFGLTPEELDDVKDLPAEKIRIVAQKISPKKAKSTSQTTGKPASGVTKGSTSYTEKQLSEMTMEQYADYVKKRDGG